MNYLYAFLIGGVLCIPAQILIDKTKLTNARILTGYVVIGVFLSALTVYSPIVDFASAGATVPLTGFGHSLAKGVVEAVNKDGLFGVLYGGMSAASAGISMALIIALVFSIIFKSKQK